MEPERLKNDFGSDIVFWGGIDTQKTLQDGTESEIRDEIKRLLEVLGKDGGYVIAPSHNLQSTLPPQKIQLMIDCLKEYR
jgi:uroporphyrinogen decarboxylase